MCFILFTFLFISEFSVLEFLNNLRKPNHFSIYYLRYSCLIVQGNLSIRYNYSSSALREVVFALINDVNRHLFDVRLLRRRDRFTDTHLRRWVKPRDFLPCVQVVPALLMYPLSTLLIFKRVLGLCNQHPPLLAPTAPFDLPKPLKFPTVDRRCLVTAGGSRRANYIRRRFRIFRYIRD